MTDSTLRNLSPKQLLLLALEQSAELDRTRRGQQDPIAIVGLGCRFPGGASDADRYWELLSEGRDAISEVPKDRWDIDSFYDPDPNTPGKMATRWGGFLESIDQFDADFFGIAPREAAAMDPQQRLILEVCWEAIEDAGVVPSKIEGTNVGVYLGVTGGDYANLLFTDGNRIAMDAYAMTGNARNAVAGRVSYLLGLRGPSLVVDTACSSSLVALHLAGQSLRSGECRVALAGGVNIILSPEITVATSRARMMSADGRCKTFDARADGFVRSEGAGVVVLKRLVDARMDGDRIHAVIRSTSVNQDGRSGGFTVPNQRAQEDLIRDALQKGGVAGPDITYLEAHGTGTPLGDPVEVEAAARTLGVGRKADRPLILGSVKTNLGHLEAAAGVAGLIKAALALKHRKIPAHLHFSTLNEAIDLAAIPATIPTVLTDWPERAPLLAGVSSFGASGTNAHVLLEAAPLPARADGRSDQRQVLTLSARSEDALLDLADRYAEFITRRPDISFSDLCWSASHGRAEFEYRATVLANDAREACERLRALRSGDAVNVFRGTVNRKRTAEVAKLDGTLECLAEQWVAGKQIDWKTVAGGGARARVDLPLYPFQRQRYWLGTSRPVETEPVENILFETQWRECAPLAQVPAKSERWLIISDANREAEKVSTGLTARGHDVRTLHLPSDWNAGAIAKALADCDPRRVVYMSTGDEQNHVESVSRACGQLSSLLTTVVAMPPERRPRIAVVTIGAAGPAPSARVLSGCALWGLGRTALLEHPDVALDLIDYDPGAGHDSINELVTGLTTDASETQRSLRSGTTYVPRLSHARHESAPGFRPRADATYLITGGVGALGLQIASYLVQAGARRLLLVGRSEPGAAAHETIADLRRRGAEIVTARVDVGVAADLEAAIKAHCTPDHPLRGVVHAAGVIDDGILIRQTQEKIDSVLAPKVAGAWNLHKATEHLPLDWFVLMSSAASLLGSVGQSNYAAANAFLDGLAVQRQAEGLPAISINWGAWEGEGMVSSLDDAMLRRRAELGMSRLSAAQALDVFGRLTSITGVPQIGVLPLNWERMARSLPTIPLFLSELCRTEPSNSGADLLERVRAAPEQSRSSVVGEIVHEAAAKVLGRAAPLPPDVGFFELGMDSLMALELQNALQKGFGDAVKLPSTLIFDFPTPADLQRYLLGELDLRSSDEVPVATPAPTGGKIAIVGVGLRFPGGASDLDSFWRLLREGGNAVSEVPSDRWDVDDWYDSDPEVSGKTYVRSGAFLRDIDKFDAGFFGISPREAMNMDPQQRLLLEVAWEAMERAGIEPGRAPKTGVFIGISTNEYLHRMIGSLTPDAIDAYVGLGNALSAAAGRLSFHLGLQGPSMVVDTACSSSLVALHLACRSLTAGECAVALAGGVNLMLSPFGYVHLSRARMLAPDGVSKAFEATADGYGRGEGCAVLVLKRLEDAIAAGDDIVAVIRGSATNQDGHSAGFTVPHGGAQRAVIREALAAASLEPRDVGYVEAHGTGTSLGDPIEIGALADVLGKDRDPGQPVWVGSVKANVGHLEAAAGAAGVIKAVLSIRHGEIPPQPTAGVLNPHIPWSEIPVRVPFQLTPWSSSQTRIAGVSSFGFTGSNAHVILEAAPPQARPQEHETGTQTLLLSAKSEDRLRLLARGYVSYLIGCEEANLADVCASARAGRAAFDHRIAVVGASPAEIAARLDSFLENGNAPGVFSAGTNCDPLELPRTRDALEWVRGGALDLQSPPRRRIPIPVTPFVRQRYWFSESRRPSSRVEGAAASPLLGRRIGSPAMRDIVFENTIDAQSPSWLADHRVHGATIVAGATHVASICQAAQSLFKAAPIEIRHVEFPQPNILANGRTRRSQLVLNRSDDSVQFRVLSTQAGDEEDDGTWIVHAQGQLTRVPHAEGDGKFAQVRRDAEAWTNAPVDQFYERIESVGVQLGPSFRCIEDLSFDRGRSLGRMRIPADAEGLYAMHFGLIDSCFQVMAAAFGSYAPDEAGKDVFVPASVDSFTLFKPASGSLWCYACVEPAPPEQSFIVGSFTLYDDAGSVVANASGVHMQRAPADLLLRQVQAGRRDVFYGLTWEDQPGEGNAAPLEGSWLVIGEKSALADNLVAEIAKRGGDGVCIHDPSMIEAKAYTGVVDLRGVTLSAEHVLLRDIAQACARRCFGLIDLHSALRRSGASMQRLYIVTCGAQEAGEHPTLAHPEQATLWGFARVLRTEEPRFKTILVDIDPAAASADSANAIASEMSAASDETEVAFRTGRRRVIRLDAMRNLPSPIPNLDPDVSYLITGGHGALGRLFCRWLVDRGARDVVLAARRGKSGETAALAAELASVGATIRYVTCDVTNANDVRSLIATAHSESRPLRGIIHAAGILDDAPYAKLTEDRIAAVLAPKIEGARQLAMATEEMALEFFVLFSSAAAILGTAGQANYAAANAYLDSLAHALRARNVPAVSIGWGPWDAIGMTSHLSDQQRARWAALGLQPIDAELGQSALERMITSGTAHAMVISVQWDRFVARLPAESRPPLLSRLLRSSRVVPPVKVADLRSLVVDSSVENRATKLRSIIQDAIAQVLMMESGRVLEPTSRLFDIGLDSLMAVELKDRLESGFGLHLPSTLLFENPTPELLSRFIETELFGSSRREEDQTAALQPADLAAIDGISDDELARMIDQEYTRVLDEAATGPAQ